MGIESALPQVAFGRHRISRLVLGGNPMHGGSHMSFMVSRPMREFYTPERVQEVLRRAEEVGINTWQSSGGAIDAFCRYRESGGSMQYICIENDPSRVAGLAARGAIAIAHHGETTDQLFKQGKLGEVKEFLARVRDAGLMVGVSTHMPAVVAAIEEQGWDIDYFMCCVYERHRTREELRRMLGEAPIPQAEVYLERDPERMYQAIREAKRPCLAFKILAAGRLCERPEDVEGAFRSAFAGIKPTDGVIVGMYPRYSDQIAENAGYTRKYGAL